MPRSQPLWSLHALRLLALLGAIAGVLTLLPPLDYRYFAAAARAWRSGASQLYDSHTTQFFYAPWSLILLAPLSALPDGVGQAILNLVSLVGVAWGVWALARPVSARALTLALASPATASLLILGQWDGLVVGGVALAWLATARRQPWLLGLALVVVTTKPTNALLCAPVILYAVRRWPWRALAAALAAPLLALAGAFWACGADWPLRYAQYIQATPPRGYNVSLWHLAGVGPALLVGLAALAWLFWTTRGGGVTGHHLALALVVSMVVSPFVVPYHYIGTAPALALVAQRNWRLGAALWAGALAAFVAFFLRWSDLPLALCLLGVLISSAAALAPPGPAAA